MKVSDQIRRFVFGTDKRLQFTGRCLSVIIPQVVLDVFGLGVENREITLRIVKEGILICPRQQ